MNRLIKISLCGFLFLSCEKQTKPTEFTSLSTLFEDRTASTLIKAERYEDALAIYLNMLEKEPLKPEVHSNVGVIMSQIQKPEDAVKSLLHALKLAEEQKDFPTLFAVNFNLGVYYGAQKNSDLALKHYQAALDILPTSIQTKTNIELLTQMQNQSGKGESENKDQQQNQDSKDQKDQKDQKQGNDQKEQKDKKDQQTKDDQDKKDQKDKNQDQENEKKNAKSSAKYKPRPYQGDQLSEGDVKKILGELRNQEQKIRANFDKKDQKDQGHEKDW